MLGSIFRKPGRTETAMFRISLSVLGEIRRTIGALPAEYGGVLGGHPDDGVVTEFYFDRAASRTSIAYSPDVQALNKLFKRDWNPKGIRVMGFVHSHPGLRELSYGDLTYARRLLDAIPDLDRLLTPIVISAADAGRFEILPYAVVSTDRGVDVMSLSMTVVDDDRTSILDWESALTPDIDTYTDVESAPLARESAMADDGVPGDAIAAATNIGTAAPAATGVPVPGAFRRVVHAYDLDLLRECRVIYVGAGGAAGFIEDLTRAGVGQHVLIDPDIVAETNLATQQTYRRDIGRPKVEAIADRIRDINPEALVVPLKMSLDDIDDQAFEFYAAASTARQTVRGTLICGLTDNFYAQARVNRLALQFGLPSLSAQVYREGRGAEITFTHADVTPACHRCALSARYRAYLENGYTNVVTSDGTPIFATTRLNALKGFVTMALLHHGSTDARWGGLLQRIGNRNLVQLRLDPDLATTVGLGVFDRVFENADLNRLFFDETVWLPQEPEGRLAGTRPCPDCGGTGTLRTCIGTFLDTRTMRK